MNLSPEILTQIGPIGILVVLLLVVYLQLGPRMKAQHTENTVKLDQILGQLTLMNGRVGKLEEWRDGHDKQDDERERRHGDVHTDIHREISTNRESLHAVRNEMMIAATRRALDERPK